MHIVKFILLLTSSCVTATLIVSLLWHVAAAWTAPHIWRATGRVVEIKRPPAGDADRVPSSGPRVVVEFKDPKGVIKREIYNSFNSGGATEFADRKVGEAIQFDVQIEGPAPGSRRRFDWQNAGKVHWVLGGALVVIGALLYFL